jgi:hypothetical protein
MCQLNLDTEHSDRKAGWTLTEQETVILIWTRSDYRHASHSGRRALVERVGPYGATYAVNYVHQLRACTNQLGNLDGLA